jgi:hypothetical protein
MMIVKGKIKIILHHKSTTNTIELEPFKKLTQVKKIIANLFIPQIVSYKLLYLQQDITSLEELALFELFRNKSIVHINLIETAANDEIFLPKLAETKTLTVIPLSSADINCACGNESIGYLCRGCNVFICKTCKESNLHFLHQVIKIDLEDIVFGLKYYASAIETDINTNVKKFRELSGENLFELNLDARKENIIEKINILHKSCNFIFNKLPEVINFTEFLDKGNFIRQNNSEIIEKVTKGGEFLNPLILYSQMSKFEKEIFEMNKNIYFHKITKDINSKINEIFLTLEKAVDEALTNQSMLKFNFDNNFDSEGNFILKDSLVMNENFRMNVPQKFKIDNYSMSLRKSNKLSHSLDNNFRKPVSKLENYLSAKDRLLSSRMPNYSCSISENSFKNFSLDKPKNSFPKLTNRYSNTETNIDPKIFEKILTNENANSFKKKNNDIVNNFNINMFNSVEFRGNTSRDTVTPIRVTQDALRKRPVKLSSETSRELKNSSNIKIIDKEAEALVSESNTLKNKPVEIINLKPAIKQPVGEVVSTEKDNYDYNNDVDLSPPTRKSSKSPTKNSIDNSSTENQLFNSKFKYGQITDYTIYEESKESELVNRDSIQEESEREREKPIITVKPPMEEIQDYKSTKHTHKQLVSENNLLKPAIIINKSTVEKNLETLKRTSMITHIEGLITMKEPVNFVKLKQAITSRQDNQNVNTNNLNNLNIKITDDTGASNCIDYLKRGSMITHIEGSFGIKEEIKPDELRGQRKQDYFVNADGSGEDKRSHSHSRNSIKDESYYRSPNLGVIEELSEHGSPPPRKSDRQQSVSEFKLDVRSSDKFVSPLKVDLAPSNYFINENTVSEASSSNLDNKGKHSEELNNDNYTIRKPVKKFTFAASLANSSPDKHSISRKKIVSGSEGKRDSLTKRSKKDLIITIENDNLGEKYLRKTSPRKSTQFSKSIEKKYINEQDENIGIYITPKHINNPDLTKIYKDEVEENREMGNIKLKFNNNSRGSKGSMDSSEFKSTPVKQESANNNIEEARPKSTFAKVIINSSNFNTRENLDNNIHKTPKQNPSNAKAKQDSVTKIIKLTPTNNEEEKVRKALELEKEIEKERQVEIEKLKEELQVKPIGKTVSFKIQKRNTNDQKPEENFAEELGYKSKSYIPNEQVKQIPTDDKIKTTNVIDDKTNKAILKANTNPKVLQNHEFNTPQPNLRKINTTDSHTQSSYKIIIEPPAIDGGSQPGYSKKGTFEIFSSPDRLSRKFLTRAPVIDKMLKHSDTGNTLNLLPPDYGTAGMGSFYSDSDSRNNQEFAFSSAKKPSTENLVDYRNYKRSFGDENESLNDSGINRFVNRVRNDPYKRMVSDAESVITRLSSKATDIYRIHGKKKKFSTSVLKNLV